MAGVATTNIYALLGNDDDSDTPSAPVKTVDKNPTNTVKRNATDVSAQGSAPVGGARRTPGGNEGAFRDRGAGADRNRSKPTDDSSGGGPRGGHNARVRGGRGSRYPRDRDDRHAKNIASGSEKQAAQSWGAVEGQAELNDEEAGEAIAKKDRNEDAGAPAAPAADESPTPAPEEEEDHHMSYSDWLAQEAERKLALESESELNIRQVDESKLKKEWAAAKPLVKDDDEDFISGAGGKTKKERERKVKNTVELENRFIEPERPMRGGRGGRGEFRGAGRGGRGGRGDFRGDFRGGRGGGRGEGRGDFRGDFRGGRSAPASSPLINPNDTSAFPSLGGK